MKSAQGIRVVLRWRPAPGKTESSDVACSLCPWSCCPALRVPPSTSGGLRRGLAGTAAPHVGMPCFGEHPEQEIDAFQE